MVYVDRESYTELCVLLYQTLDTVAEIALAIRQAAQAANNRPDLLGEHLGQCVTCVEAMLPTLNTMGKLLEAILIANEEERNRK